MTMQPLGVDPPLLMGHGAEMERAAEQIPDPPAVFAPPVGSDELSAVIGREIPKAEAPILNGLPPLKLSAKETAANIQTAAERYSSTDQRLSEEYERLRFDMTHNTGGVDGAGVSGAGDPLGGVGALGGGSGSAAGADGPMGQLGQLGQMMGMPMQMAGQAVQAPIQMMGMAASVPQGAVQGVQSALQPAGQLGGGLGSAGDGASGVEEPLAAQALDATERNDQGESLDRAEPGQQGAEAVPHAYAEDQPSASPAPQAVPGGDDERIKL